MRNLQLLLIVTLGMIHQAISCSGGTSSGSLNPTSSYQTQVVSNGQYYVVNVTCGTTYYFSLCSNGGAASWDTQITINQTNNTTQLAYNDDSSCGLQSELSWTATFSGTVHVLVSKFSCNNDGSSSGVLSYNLVATTVTYSASCTSANPNISGATGGTFSFNPNPGDGATINSTTGIISNGQEGASYSVEYVYCGGTLSIPVTMGSSPCYDLNGDAEYIDVAGEDCIQLTAAQNSQTGCAWSDEQIDFNYDFSLSLDYYFGTNTSGADGSTFTFQPNPGACGDEGAQLGAGGITNSLIIEFDTYDNDGGASNDSSCDHISVEIDGDLPDDPINVPANDPPYCGPVCAKAGGGSLEDGNAHPVEISWDASTQSLNVYFDGSLRLTCNGDFITSAFGGNNIVYWGATAATGGLNNQQYFCPQTVVILPAELERFESICDRGIETLYWSTLSESNTSYFQPEYTTDGFIFYPLAVVNAAGNSIEEKNYQIDIPNNLPSPRYYRLKTIDMNGNVTNTDMIKAHSCDDEHLITELNYVDGELSLELAQENLAMSLYDMTGRSILKRNTKKIFSCNVYLAEGTYVLQVRDNEQNIETRKFTVF